MLPSSVFDKWNSSERKRAGFFPHRALYTTEMSALPDGRGFLLTNHQSYTYPRDTWLSYTFVLRQGMCHWAFHISICAQREASQLLGDHVKVVIFSCSEYEARNYGLSTLFRLFFVDMSFKAVSYSVS
jgi:hypothetical protein